MCHRILLSLLFCSSLIAGSDDIRPNQLGYYAQSVKRFVVVDSGSMEFVVKDAQGRTVRYQGSLIDAGTWAGSGERVKTGDFSRFSEPGQYVISVADKGDSHPFRISAQVYDDVLIAAVKTYYYQRASMALDEK
jgi:endoglucanase